MGVAHRKHMIVPSRPALNVLPIALHYLTTNCNWECTHYTGTLAFSEEPRLSSAYPTVTPGVTLFLFWRPTIHIPNYAFILPLLFILQQATPSTLQDLCCLLMLMFPSSIPHTRHLFESEVNYPSLEAASLSYLAIFLQSLSVCKKIWNQEKKTYHCGRHQRLATLFSVTVISPKLLGK